jgi:hypothetical protein
VGLRRALTLVATAAVGAMLAVAVPGTASAAFTDVPADAHYAADVQWMVDQGITSSPGGKFRPNATVTRQAMAVFLYKTRFPGQTAPRCTAAPFSDVPAGSDYCGSIAWLKSSGITANGATFAPLATVTRETLALLVYRLGGNTTPATCGQTDPFEDVKRTSVYCGAIAWLEDRGIEDPTAEFFRPRAAATRATIATYLHGWSDVQSPVLGADVSHPQCGGPLPAGQAFGVVGVNAGTATTTNPCLADQLAWAATSTGGTGQPLVQVYVNTANPGLEAAVWPTTSPKNRYGTCDTTANRGNTLPCAYEYGRLRAQEDVQSRGVPNARSLMWWLDVELENSWSTTSTGRNVASLEGMADHLRSYGVKGVGIYSTHFQWQQIVGASVKADSPLRGLPSWLAGTGDVDGARAGCWLTGFTSGSRVVMTQYIEGGFDRNHSCT